MKSLISLSRALFKDLRRLHPDVSGLDRDLRSIEARIESEGVGFLSVALPAFGKAFDQSLAAGKMAYIPGFSRNGQIPKFLSGIVSHIFDTKTGVLRDSAPMDAIVSVRQVCYFFKKFLPEDDRALKLHNLAVRDFENTDTEIRDVDISRLSRFGLVCSFVLPGLDEVQDFKCKHGPGAVLEGYTTNQKWKEVYHGLLDFDRRLLMIGYDLPASLLVDVTDQKEDLQDDPVGPPARLVTVPKSSVALRTITVEPCLAQFVQQGLNDALRREIRRDRILRCCLALDSQVPNQVLALEGSRTGDWCTIDLSSASDRLSLQVVKEAFAHRPRFLKALLASRTPSVKLDSNVLTLKKYAGMGNATTFPVQSVVFALLAITAITQSEKYLTSEKVRSAANDVRVFGDDIIIKTEHYQAFADWVSCFGLKINQSKTFTGGFFRESCGVDAYRGVDVTPVYLRHDPAVTSTDPSAFVSIVSTSNQLWTRCYYETADLLKQRVEVHTVLPLVPKSSAGLGWQTREDASQFQRWNRDLQRFECRTLVASGGYHNDQLEGMPALIKFYHLPRIGEDEPNHLSVSARRFNLKLRRRWVQA